MVKQYFTWDGDFEVHTTDQKNNSLLHHLPVLLILNHIYYAFLQDCSWLVVALVFITFCNVGKDIKRENLRDSRVIDWNGS